MKALPSNARERLKVLDEIDERIGKTRSLPEPIGDKNRLVIKFESQNSYGSHYDRVYAKLLRLFIERYPERDKVLELSSGSAGISLAGLCSELGIHPRIIMPESRFPIRAKIAQALGAEVIFTPEKLGVDGANAELRNRVVSDLRHEQRVFLNHSHRDESVEALHPVAEEVLATHGKITHFFSALGNGTSLRGISEPLRAANPDLKIIGVRYMDDRETGDKSIVFPGTDQVNIDFPHLQACPVDETLYLPKEQVIKQATRRGIGLSSAMVKMAAEQFFTRNQTVPATGLVIDYDAADRY